jgi:Restriction endonuclease EcoRII, N-terminal
MTKKTFSKTLSANDVGATGGHQGGILIPKSDTELLAFLPSLDPTIKNPDAWIECEDENGIRRQFRFVYYNNRLHDAHGTRNEYRVTYMTSYFREMGARAGDAFSISQSEGEANYAIRIIRAQVSHTEIEKEPGIRIKISSGWRRVH